MKFFLLYFILSFSHILFVFICFLYHLFLLIFFLPSPVNSENGIPIACDILQAISTTDKNLMEAELDSFNNSGADADVTAYFLSPANSSIDSTLTDLFCFYAEIEDMPPNILSNQCNVSENGCGIHVHSGTSCTSVDTQGGHFYNNQTLDTDTWTYVGFDSTDMNGDTFTTHCVPTGETNFLGLVMVLHSTSKSRVACGPLTQSSAWLLLPMTNIIITTAFTGLLGMFW